MGIFKRMKDFNRDLGVVQRRLKRLECEHEPEFISEASGFLFFGHYNKCSKCGKILEEFGSKEECLNAKLEHIGNEVKDINNSLALIKKRKNADSKSE